MSTAQPLARITSLKVKLGLLVAVSVTVAALVASLGRAGGVPVWLSIPVTILLALAVTQLLAVGMTSPLRQMTAAAGRMATGDYAVRVTDTSSDEVGDLARAFNTMARDLSTVDRQRRELVANVSHELRTPLAGLVRPAREPRRRRRSPRPRVAGGRARPGRAHQPPRGGPPRSCPRGRRPRTAQSGAGAARVAARRRRRRGAGARPRRGVRRTRRPCGPRRQRGSRAAPAAGRQPARQRVAAQPDRWHGRGHGVAGRRPLPRRGARPGSGRRARRPRAGLRALRHVDRAPRAAAGPASAWRSRAGSPTCTAARSASSTPSPATRAPACASPCRSRHPTVRPTSRRRPCPSRPRPPRPRPRRPLRSPYRRRPCSTASSASSGPSAVCPRVSRVLVGSLAVGVLGGLVMPFRDLGLGTFLVLLAAGGVVLAASTRRDAYTLTCAGLCALLAATTLAARRRLDRGAVPDGGRRALRLRRDRSPYAARVRPVGAGLAGRRAPRAPVARADADPADRARARSRGAAHRGVVGARGPRLRRPVRLRRRAARHVVVGRAARPVARHLGRPRVPRRWQWAARSWRRRTSPSTRRRSTRPGRRRDR